MIFFIKNKNNDLGGFRFGTDGTNNGYYITDSEGADTFYPFKKTKTSFSITIKFTLYSTYYSSEKGFIYDNTGDNKYNTLSYKYTGSCGCKIYGDGSVIKSISAPSWNSTKSGTIDISNYSELDARGIADGSAISGNLIITFS